MSIIYGNDGLASSKSEREFNQRLAISRQYPLSNNNMASNSETFDNYFCGQRGIGSDFYLDWCGKAKLSENYWDRLDQ